ncbi:EF-hand calcium-binding domain-containing protein 5 [Allomyces arbusculus]|nr:EF-hand calcium-binding domain-containing protein 5 [Allomyces arbusculus]
MMHNSLPLLGASTESLSAGTDAKPRSPPSSSSLPLSSRSRSAVSSRSRKTASATNLATLPPLDPPPPLHRTVSINALADDFLTFAADPGAAIELRSYLVESTLPTVVLALERLLTEVERKRVAPPSWTGSLSVDQHDHLVCQFDPIVWLAQFLFRNNPRYSNALQSSSYSKNLRAVSNALQDRFFELQENRIARLKAAQEERERERERKRVLKRLAFEEKRKSTAELTAAIFRRLQSLQSNHEPLKLQYLLSVLQQVGQSPGVVINPSLNTSMQALNDSLLELSQLAEADDARDSHALLQHVSDVLMHWTPQDFETFLTELTLWMNSQERQLEDKALAALIGELRGSGADLLDTLMQQLIGPGAEGAGAGSDRSGHETGVLPGDMAEELRKLDLETATNEQIGGVLKKVALFSVGSVANLMRRLHEVAKALPVATADDSAGSAEDAADGDDGTALDEPPAEDIAMVRKAKLKLLFAVLDKDHSGMLLSRDVNALLVQAGQSLDRDLGHAVVQMKLAIPVLAMLTHTIQADYFIDYFSRKMSGLTDSEFAQVMRALHDTAREPAPPVVGKSVQDHEARLLADLDKLGAAVHVDYLSLCNRLLRPAVDLVRLCHSQSHVVVGLFDRSVMVLASSDPAEIGLPMLGDVVAHVVQSGDECTAMVMRTTDDGSVNQVTDASWAEAWRQHQQKTDTSGANAADAAATGDVAAAPQVQAEVQVGQAIFVPVKSAAGEVIGVVQVDVMQSVPMSKNLATNREFDLLTDADIAHARHLAEALARAIGIMERMTKTATIAESSASFIREQANATTKFFIFEAEKMYYACETDHDAVASKRGEMGDLASHVQSPTHPCRYLRPPRYSLAPVDRTGETEFIFGAAESRTTSIRGQATAVPVQDQDGQVIAVMVVTSLSQSAVQQEDMDEVNKVAEVLAAALSNVRKAKPRKRELEAEAMDEEGELIFAKFMLDQIRDSISKLDASAIAELKSYKKPPLTIHKVLKCLCYLFGKTPKQVRLWSDTLKFINMELLKQMVAYDPTATQKKAKFVRIRKVLKTIPHGDVKKRGSLPAQTVYAWLIVSLDLRDKAVQARKRAQGDLANSLSSNGNETEPDGEDDEERDDED